MNDRAVTIRRHSWKQDAGVVAVLVVCCIIMSFLPSVTTPDTNAQNIAATVLTTDNSQLQQHGILQFGSQMLTVRLEEGPQAGIVFRACNELRAQLELDNFFEVGDRIVVVLFPSDTPDDSVLVAKTYERATWTYVLCALFCLLICVFGRWTGVKALFSFYLSVLVIWKAVIPLLFDGWSASWTIFVAVCFLTAAIMFLVAGVTRKGVSAFLGAISGVFVGLLLAHCFSRLIHINGAVLPYSQTLLTSGYDFVDLKDLFVGAMILASSGAVMDLGMDISAGVEEVCLHNPNLTRRQLIASGMRMGRSVVGTMTTTLLLAYSGGYITLLMMFAAQGNDVQEIICNPLVASECVKTLIGSFSLVLVAPFTALFAGILFGKNRSDAVA